MWKKKKIKTNNNNKSCSILCGKSDSAMCNNLSQAIKLKAINDCSDSKWLQRTTKGTRFLSISVATATATVYPVGEMIIYWSHHGGQAWYLRKWVYSGSAVVGFNCPLNVLIFSFFCCCCCCISITREYLVWLDNMQSGWFFTSWSGCNHWVSLVGSS